MSLMAGQTGPGLETQSKMDRLVSEAGPAQALQAMAASLTRLASHRERMGSLAPVAGLKSAAEDLLALVERV